MLSLSPQINFYLRKPKRFPQLILAAVLTVTLLPTIRVVIYGQANQPQERIIKKSSWPKEPVKIVKLKVKGKSVGLGEKLLGDDDWLKSFTISVKNTSNKAIQLIELKLVFPRNDSQEPPMLFRLPYGHMPPPPGQSARPDKPRSIAPNETIDLVLSDELYSNIKEYLEATKYPPSIKEVKINIGRVVFDDDTMWEAAMLLRRNPSNPEEWVVVGEYQGDLLNRDIKPFSSTDVSFGTVSFLAGLQTGRTSLFKISRTILPVHMQNAVCGHLSEDIRYGYV